MKFNPTIIKGAFVVELEPHADERGFFSRAFCAKEFEAHGISNNMVQTNYCKSHDKGTLRGMHFQKNGHEETKLIRCVRGSVLDVVVDVRKDSETYCQWVSAELTASNFKAMVVPEGCAHGYLTLEDDSDVIYQVSAFYSKENEDAVRWDDPAFGIEWPIENPILSGKDAIHPDFVK